MHEKAGGRNAWPPALPLASPHLTRTQFPESIAAFTRV
jgi:hypothetical protein